jgi:hypothetical protein
LKLRRAGARLCHSRRIDVAATGSSLDHEATLREKLEELLLGKHGLLLQPCIVSPPLTETTWPVMKSVAGVEK